MTKWTILGLVTLLIIIAGAALVIIPGPTANAPAITSFTECAAAGYPVQESYPRRCTTPEGATFTEEVAQQQWVTTRGNADIIRNVSVREGQTISSPLTITGEARGMWFFEASFPVVLTNWDGLIIAEVPAEAVLDPSNPDSTWMTEEYVPFSATLTFTTPTPGDPAVNRGSLILHKSNASGLPEHDDAYELQVVFE
jgi:hypothetical protein